MGKKYIIELPENTHWIQWILESTEDHHPYMDFRHVEDLTPYTEPDLEQVRKEAYEQGRKDGKIEGQVETWVCAKKIAYMYSEERKKIFGENLIQNIHDIYSASEAIEKIRQYEQVKNELDQEEENIQVGDEVKSIERGWTAVVARISDDDSLTLMDSSGAIADAYNKTMFVKTGRHFPEIAEVLEKMRGEQDG